MHLFLDALPFLLRVGAVAQIAYEHGQATGLTHGGRKVSAENLARVRLGPPPRSADGSGSPPRSGRAMVTSAPRLTCAVHMRGAGGGGWQPLEVNLRRAHLVGL